MNKDTCLVVDVWEGSLEMDEAALKAAGVAGIGIRLNDMNGGHHKDGGFDKQWAEAAGFVRFPYFVYNPWVDGATNYAWLANNMPAGALSVAVDVEVRKTGYLPAVYAGEFEKFLQLANLKWKVIVYTAEWFLGALSKWPKMDYWWAQYPDPTRYFAGVTTWEELKTRLDNPVLLKPFNAGACPGTVKMWQFSGDFLILEGCLRDIDVNLFYGTVDELKAFFGSGGEVVVAEPVEPEPEPVVSAPLFIATVTTWLLNVRKDALASSVKVGSMFWGAKAAVYELAYEGTNVWGRTLTGWVALLYNGSYYTDWRKPVVSTNKIGYVLPRVLSYAGPAIIAGSDGPKQNHPTFALDASWQNFIKAQSFNREDVWALFSDQWVGPSKGLNGVGKLIYIPATWSFNVVSLTGNRANGWVEIVAIDMRKGVPAVGSVNHAATPTLVSRMTTTTKDGGWCDYPLKNGMPSPWVCLNDPILSLTGTLWIPEEFVTTSCVVGTTLNIRSGAGTSYAAVGQYTQGQVVEVFDVKNEGNNMWGKTDRGWICLRYGATYYSNWKIR